MQYIEQIEKLWQMRDNLSSDNEMLYHARSQIEYYIDALNNGKIRVAEKRNGRWETNEWVKKAILLYFKVADSKVFEGDSMRWYDKVHPKFTNATTAEDFKEQGARIVPGAFIRTGSYIGKNSVIMPSFINIGAYVDEGTMIDTWATVGSCAQIGKNCHISGGAGIGGVLEPLQSTPVIIEDNCFIGARSEIVEGVIVEEGAVVSMGVLIGASTKIVDRVTGKIIYGRVPPYSVVVPGSLPSTNPSLPGIYCAVILKQVDAKTRSKTSVNELLRGE